MYGLEIVKHSNINKLILDQIISIKTVAWPYSYENQKKWIEANLKGDDLHVLLKQSSISVAYLNLVITNIFINGASCPAFGVGNVCSKYEKRGFGKVLLMAVNDYIVENNMVGLLFCKDGLIPFYEKCDWKKSGKTIKGINMMVYAEDDIKNIYYDGKLF